MGWLITRRERVKGLGVQLSHPVSEGEGLGRKGWLGYASVLEGRAAKLRSRLHGDLRKQMKGQRAGREAKLSGMMEPASEEGGCRGGAALSNGLRKGRDGAVDSAVIRGEVSEAGVPPRARAAASAWGGGEEEYTGVLGAVDGVGQSLLVPQP